MTVRQIVAHRRFPWLAAPVLALTVLTSLYVGSDLAGGSPPVQGVDATKPAELALQVPATLGPKVEGLELIASPSDTVTTRQRVVVVTAKTAAPAVKWVVLSSVPKSPVAFMEVPLAAKTLLVFPNDQEDAIAVLCYTVVGGNPTDPARLTITVQATQPGPPPIPKPGPTPQPQPTPPDTKPLPAGTKLHVTMVFDHQHMTPGLANLENSADLRDALKAGGHKLHVLDVKQKVLDDRDLRQYVPQGNPFVLIIQDDQGDVILHGPLPATAAEVAAKVKTLTGGQ